MPSCCYGDEYGEVFTAKEAVSTARRYRNRGLSRVARELVEAITARGLGGASVLEVGGGIGALHLELLERGAAAATNIDLSPSWEEPALGLAEERGLAGRVSRRLGDFCDMASELEDADIVVMHRVVCCYPNWRTMLELGTGKARRLLALTFPADHWWTKRALALGNAYMRIRGSSFRAFVHPPAEMIDLVRRAGYTVVYNKPRWVWQTVVFERVA